MYSMYNMGIQFSALLICNSTVKFSIMSGRCRIEICHPGGVQEELGVQFVRSTGERCSMQGED